VCAVLSACAEPHEAAEPFRLAGHRYDSVHVRHLKLPKVLREISGLTLEDGRALAHNDERGVIYRIDYEAGRVVSRFSMDDGVKGDFEGIAVADGRLYLVTSRGEIFETRPGGDDEQVPYVRHAEQLDCEVEGLTFDPRRRMLLVACKNLPGKRRDIVLHAWDPERRAYDPSPILLLEASRLKDFLDTLKLSGDPIEKVQPTGITIARNGNLVLVAARQYLLLELTPEGDPVAAVRLDPAVQRQAEGIAIDRQGRLLVGSEGDGKGDRKTRGVLSIYEPVD
jgi:hypothetical protein